jgi:hypothetical protein
MIWSGASSFPREIAPTIVYGAQAFAFLFFLMPDPEPYKEAQAQWYPAEFITR